MIMRKKGEKQISKNVFLNRVGPIFEGQTPEEAVQKDMDMHNKFLKQNKEVDICEYIMHDKPLHGGYNGKHDRGMIIGSYWMSCKDKK